MGIQWGEKAEGSGKQAREELLAPHGLTSVPRTPFQPPFQC